MNGEISNLSQLFEDDSNEVTENLAPQPEILLNLLEKKVALKELLTSLDEEQFKKYAVKITQFAIKKAGLNINNLGLHFLRGNVIRGIFREGFRPGFHGTKGISDKTHRTIDYWLFDNQTSILDLDENMNSLYRKSGYDVSVDFVLINRKFISDNGQEESQFNNKKWTRGILPVAILEDDSCPAETIFGLGALSPFGIIDIRQLNNGGDIMESFSLERKELLESGENGYLNNELTRNNQIDMILRFVESLAYIASQRKRVINKD